MATQKQKKLAKAIVENATVDKPKTMKELVVSSGYDITTAEKQVPAILELKGIKEELAKLGFDESNAKRVVGQILNDGEDQNRLKAADLIFKVQGSYAPDKSINVNVSVIDDETVSKIADELNAKMINVYQGTSISSNGEVSSSMAQEVRNENREGDTA